MRAGRVFAQSVARFGKGRVEAVLLHSKAAEAFDQCGQLHAVWLSIVGKQRVQIGFQQPCQRRKQLYIRAGEIFFPLVDGLRRYAEALGHLFLRQPQRPAP